MAKINKAEEEISKGNCIRYKTAKELCDTMQSTTITCVTTKEQYDSVRFSMEYLIKEATRLNMLEPETDNEYIREIGRLAKMSAEYEDNYMFEKS